MGKLRARARALVLVGCACFASQAQSATFSLPIGKPSGVAIDGKINSGDLARFRAFVADQQSQSRAFDERTVLLNSPGGDVAEALAFATLFDRDFYTTVVIDQRVCYSACAIMFAGGVERLLGRRGKLGFHRMVLRAPEIDMRRAQAVTEPANKIVNDFLRHVGFPNLLIDKMNETPPSDLFIVDMGWLARHELERQVYFQPAFLDVVEKRCGPDPATPSRGLTDAATFPKQAFTQWVDCANGVMQMNIEIARAKQREGDARAEKTELDAFIRAKKSFHWESVSSRYKEHFIDQQSAKWNAQNVRFWSLENKILLGKPISLAYRAEIDCIEKTSTIIETVGCDSRMCERPRSVKVFVPQPPLPLDADSPFGRAAAILCPIQR